MRALTRTMRSTFIGLSEREREGEKYLRTVSTRLSMRAVLLTMFDSVLCSLELCKLDLSIVDNAVSD